MRMYPRDLLPLEYLEGVLNPFKDFSIGFSKLDLIDSFATHLVGFEKDTDLVT